MSSDASRSARELELQLAAIGSPERAEGETRHLKSDSSTSADAQRDD
jgi:hypothetical protein